MARWRPDAMGRLQHAAMTLFVERGYEQTTVADIADAAGLTARTFFRYFTDKPEVLFAGADDLTAGVLAAVSATDADARPLTAVAAGLSTMAQLIGSDHGFSVQRQAVIGAVPDLHERELRKLAGLAGLLAGALAERGVDPTEAALAAETGMAVFRVGFERWIGSDGGTGLPEILADSFARLRTLAG